LRRVVITGLGVLAPGGLGTDNFFGNLIANNSAITRLPQEFSEHLNLRYAGQVVYTPGDHFPQPQLRTMDRVSQLALIAAKEALTDAGLNLTDQEKLAVGVYLGTAVSGATTLDEGYDTLYRCGGTRLKPFTVLMVMNNAPTACLTQEFGFGGPSLTFSTACSSASVAIGEAARCIKSGTAEVMVAGGAEAPLTYGQLKAWEAMRTLALEDPHDPAGSCKPFARDRSGFVLGEGAGIVVLESAEHAARRGARVYAELLGYQSMTDLGHLARPTVGGQARVMAAAVADADLRVEDIGYINAHGTGTVLNDAAETAAVKEVFGRHAYSVAISSTKGAHGHMLGAAGAVEFIASVKALQESVIPPTLHLSQPDPTCDLDFVPNRARSAQLEAVMSNSFAFGGTNAVLVAGRWLGALTRSTLD
jgi:3-oxoacyl-(acyl-carrier-protein) synthase